jgi:micrococcal nuclease
MYPGHDYPALQAGEVIAGKVVGVTDGDSIKFHSKTNNGIRVFEIRLAEIDAPEKHQAYGNKAKQALSDKIFGKEVSITVVSTDRYGRTVAQVYITDRWINLEMVAGGWAWQYLQYSKSKEIAQAEQQARVKKLGLWADRDPVPPWGWRKPTQVKPDDETQIQPLFKVGW